MLSNDGLAKPLFKLNCSPAAYLLAANI